MTPPYIALLLKIVAIVLFLLEVIGIPLGRAPIPLGLACWCASTI